MSNHCQPRLRAASYSFSTPVMTIIFFADGTRVGPIDSEARRLDQRWWLSERAPGELADGPSNPLLWPPRGA
jgi:hypothetical protein